MPPPSANDPLRTTDHDPNAAPPTADGPGDFAQGSSVVNGGTVDQVSGQDAETKDTVPERGPASVLVPGYEIEDVLGRGGMGVVYKARHLTLKRTVALKMVLAGGHAGPRELARFRIEAEAVARLQHPNIVQIHEVGEADGHPYCALEFVEGGNLASKLDGKPLPAGEAAQLTETLARAMQLAHSRNVVHRDLKPANILLTAEGTPKITDFGLARQLDSDSGETQAGAVMGTPSYMAPEQASGRAHEAGPAADIYALGAILYVCLAGGPPFKGKTMVETLDLVRTQEPVPPSRLQKSVPVDLETICLKCLRKEPEKRYASAAELADDLVRYQQGEPILARPVGRIERAVKWVRRNPVVTGAAVAVVLALALGTTVSYLKYLDAEQQRGIAEGKEREARQEADKAKKARAFLVSIFEFSDAHGLRGTMTARQILDDAEKRIPEKFADQPELQKELLADVERVFAKITANAPLAMILEVSGTVQLQSTRNPNQRAVPRTLLYTGDCLTPAADAQVQLVFLSDLHKERLQPDKKATVHRKGCEPADAISERAEDVLLPFVRLPRGTFYLGWDGKNKGRQMEVKEDFEIAVHAVTQGQWQAVMGNNPSSYSRFGTNRKDVKDISDEELKLFPVETVSWDDVQEFIKELNEREKGRGWLYRLPTATEWEYACRGGATSEEECSYHFYFDKPTNALSSEQANFNGNEPFGKAPNGKYLGRTTRVGAYPSNKLGLCDMHGNVWQWCADLGGSARVCRGGSWSNRGLICRAANRLTIAPANRLNYLGFRLARVPVR
ncbi:MAG TPA: bifunctional serine/threonine-protein kinase/formylglycine-generating enzyme family protein [Gemmataceae bacterium]|nr:bifunctional serine/threonine-protein kinase/formylglycine-generating enzyme family protein [Gemmataceae bacterium]